MITDFAYLCGAANLDTHLSNTPQGDSLWSLLDTYLALHLLVDICVTLCSNVLMEAY